MNAQRPYQRPVTSSLHQGAWTQPQPQPRAPMMTRRYEICWLTPHGTIESSTRIAPATPDFEECAAAVSRGTLIATDVGHVAVEDLLPGMRAVTVEGRVEPIQWIGSISLFTPPSLPDMAPVRLTRVTAEAFGMARPMSDLVLGPRARLLLRDPRCRNVIQSEQAYAPARGFVDGISVIEVSPAAPLTMFHIVLRRHGTLKAAGLELEAYHPGARLGELMDPQMAGLFMSLFPQMATLADFGPLAHPRIAAADLAMMRDTAG